MKSRHPFWLSVLMLTVTLFGSHFAAAQGGGDFRLFAPLVRNLNPATIFQLEALLVSNRDGPDNIYVAPAAGQPTTLIADNNTNYRDPVLSPNGNTILYVGGTLASPALYRIDVDGTNRRQIADIPGIESDYQWSPDGQKILFLSTAVDNATLYVVSANGGSPLAIANNVDTAGQTAWSPDGTLIGTQVNSMNGTSEVATITPDGATTTLITENSANDDFAGWLNDGDLMLVNRFNGTDYDIYTYASTGDEEGTAVVVTSENTRALSISPSGNYWLYENLNETFGVVETASNETVIVDTGCIGILCNTLLVTWSPNEAEIAYTMAQIYSPSGESIDVYRASLTDPSPTGAAYIESADEFYWSPVPDYAIYRKRIPSTTEAGDTFYPVIRNLVDGTEIALGDPADNTTFHGWLPLR